MRDAFVRALSELAAEDPGVMLITGDLGFGVLTDFAERFPSSYLNAGVAEQNMTAVACGAAMAGARAYTYSIGNFPTLRCLEQLRNDVCHHRADVTVWPWAAASPTASWACRTSPPRTWRSCGRCRS